MTRDKRETRRTKRRGSSSGLSGFCEGFGLGEEALGMVTRIGRRCFLVGENDRVNETLRHLDGRKAELFGVGVFLGEEKSRFEPSPACVELIATKMEQHKAVVDEKAEWLFLCGRDLFNKAFIRRGEPTRDGLWLVENAKGENLGYGVAPTARGRRKEKNVAIKNLLDRGFYLRRERFA